MHPIDISQEIQYLRSFDNLETLRKNLSKLEKNLTEFAKKLPSFHPSIEERQQLTTALTSIRQTVSNEHPASKVVELANAILLQITPKASAPAKEVPPAAKPKSFLQMTPTQEFAYLGSDDESFRSFVLANSIHTSPQDVEAWVLYLGTTNPSRFIASHLKERDRNFWNLISPLPTDMQRELLDLYRSTKNPEQIVEEIPARILAELSRHHGSLPELQRTRTQKTITESGILQDINSLEKNGSAELKTAIEKIRQALRHPEHTFEKIETLAQEISKVAYEHFKPILNEAIHNISHYKTLLDVANNYSRTPIQDVGTREQMKEIIKDIITEAAPDVLEELVESLIDSGAFEPQEVADLHDVLVQMQAFSRNILVPMLNKARQLDEALKPHLNDYRKKFEEKITSAFPQRTTVQDLSVKKLEELANEFHREGILSMPSNAEQTREQKAIRGMVEKSKIQEHVKELQHFVKDPATLQEIRNLQSHLDNAHSLVNFKDITSFINTIEQEYSTTDAYQDDVATYQESLKAHMDKLEHLLPTFSKEQRKSLENLLYNSNDLTYEDLQYITKLHTNLISQLPTLEYDELFTSFGELIHSNPDFMFLDLKHDARQLDNNMQELYAKSPLRKYRDDFKESVKEYFSPMTAQKKAKGQMPFWDFVASFPMDIKNELFARIQAENSAQDIPPHILVKITQALQKMKMLRAPDRQKLINTLEKVRDQDHQNIHHRFTALRMAIQGVFSVIPADINDVIKQFEICLKNPACNLHSYHELTIRLKTLVLTYADDKELPEVVQENLEHACAGLDAIAERVDDKLFPLLDRFQTDLLDNVQRIMQSAKVAPSFDAFTAAKAVENMQNAEVYVTRAKERTQLLSNTLRNMNKNNLSSSIETARKIVSQAPVPKMIRDFYTKLLHPKISMDQARQVLEDMNKRLQPSFLGLHRTLFPGFGAHLDALTEQAFQERGTKHESPLQLLDLYEQIQHKIVQEEIRFGREHNKPYWAMRKSPKP
jgi:hypothetical protein